MTENSTDARQASFRQLGADIARMSNAQLQHLVVDSKACLGHGLSRIITLDQSKVFVKRIPVTDLEYENFLSTQNFYALPNYCSYGLGSIRLGVFRELIVHLKTTHWVLSKDIKTFPLLYHHRLMPISGPRMEIDENWLNSFVERWGQSKQVRQYVIDRASANHELMLFLEYIPHVLASWLPKNPGQLQKVLQQLWMTVSFLRQKGIVHFDAHFHNILTDGDSIYLTDFGLAVDKHFALSESEVVFLQKNTLYDYAEILRNLDHLLRETYHSCSEHERKAVQTKYGIEKSLEGYSLGTVLLSHLEQIQTDGTIKLNESDIASILKYRSSIILAREFYTEIWHNKQKDTEFPTREFKALLESCGIIDIPLAQKIPAP